MPDKTTDLEWTLPIVDSDSSKTEASGISNTGAWATYAIGAVTKNLLKADVNKKFPLIEEDEHPVHLSRISSESAQNEDSQKE